jgi:hypothetical protein
MIIFIYKHPQVPGHVGWRGKVWLKYGEVGRCWLLWSAPLCRRARPCGGGRALVAYLIGRGLNSSTYIDYLIGRGFGDFLLFFDAAKS